MNDDVWVAIEMTYDCCHELQSFLGVAKTRRVAEQHAKKYRCSNYYEFVYDDFVHEDMAGDRTSHVYIFKTPLWKGQLK